MRFKKSTLFLIVLILCVCNIRTAEIEDYRKTQLLELKNGHRLRELVIDIQDIYINLLPIESIDPIAREIVHTIRTYDQYEAFLNYIYYVLESRAREVEEIKKKVPEDQLWKFEYNKNTIYDPMIRSIELIKDILIGKELSGHLVNINY